MSELLSRVTLPTGIELDVWDSGPRDAPALIFLHGFPENHRTWRHQIEHLNTRFRCIAPDQRGYGNSSRPGGIANYTVQLLVQDIAGIAEVLELESYTILGHDWGGSVAWLVAAFGQADGKVARAVIANAPHPIRFQQLLFTDPAQREASQYMRAFRDPANDAMVREHGLAALLQSALNWDKRPDYDPAELQLLASQWSDPDRAFAMLNWYRATIIQVPAMEVPYILPDNATPIHMPKIEIPVHVVWGMEDPALLPANIEKLEKHVSHLTIDRIADAGHFIPWEAPDAVNAALDKFLGS